jgi:organic radical activating enzyme
MEPNPIVALPLMEHFYTLQGEGRFTGHASYFIRLGGCDVGCVWCDVKDSWDASKHPLVPITEIVASVVASGTKIAVVTGGEPMMHNLDALTEMLKAKGIRTHVETSGAHPLSGTWDWICLSPKKFKAPLDEMIAAAHELKTVIYNKSDFDWAEQYAAKVSKDCLLYLQPEWSRAAAMNPLIIDHVKANPQWKFSLQTHKFLDIP